MTPKRLLDRTFHIAQANIALGRAPLTDPVMHDFVEQLDYINAVADHARGFVWRAQTDDGDATAIRVFDNPLMIFNMSVWASVEDLYAYVFESDHGSPLKDRRTWFVKMDRPHSVLWWVPEGERPSVAEAEERLNLLHELGPSPDAFTFAKLFDPMGSPMVRGSRMDRGCGV